MVKSIQRYTLRSEKERAALLRRLTYRQSAAQLEQLLRSRLVFELNFSNDDHPPCLKQIRPQKPVRPPTLEAAYGVFLDYLHRSRQRYLVISALAVGMLGEA